MTKKKEEEVEEGRLLKLSKLWL